MSVKDQSMVKDVPKATADTCFGMEKTKAVEMLIDGLIKSPRAIASLFFYDDLGSDLFKKITQLPEYYVTKLEVKLLKQLSPHLIEFLTECDIVELGSGDCQKVSTLLDSLNGNLDSTRYIPVDISRKAIDDSTESLTVKYPGLALEGIVGDLFTQINTISGGRKRLFMVLGSTIGNFSSYKRKSFFKNLRKVMTEKDLFILGVDLIKDKSILESAYNDSQNITADFNLNILNVANSVLHSNFDIQNFCHRAFYNERHSRIEMHIEALREMQISSPCMPFKMHIRKGERIHTENSYKFTLSQIAGELKSAGFKPKEFHNDSMNWFSLVTSN
ncbi:L-histidine N(alpha)-methyltransferase [Chitinispirillales bacterium ANBcel5]|uniref:L-histidine N(alpha)-methyltransferase n=1 Tax=Cellulosispirillum alkaliphilum TaxID=3039283 RepID=UPI002A50C6F0|nr:L-histidine N(alpha)-methyltransferase [Chitinispirillales bacterium ANBcel5]